AADTWQGVPEVSGLSTSTTAAPNPPVFNPSGWSSDPTMWLISNHMAGDGGIAISAPANYTGTLIRSGTGGGGGGGDALMASAYRFLNAESEDPGSFTNGQSRSTTTSTIAVRGKQVSYYPKTIFPVVASTNSSAQTADATRHNILLPSGITRGDLLLVFYTDKSGATTIQTAGWNLLYDQPDATSVGVRRSAYYRIADGTEGVSVEFITSGNERSAHASYRILAGTYQGAPIAGAVSSSTTDNAAPNPLAHNPGWGKKNILWIAASHSTGDDNNPIPVPPANYENLLTGYSGNSGTGHARIVTAQRELTSDVENPDPFTLGSNVAWFANTIAIQGSGYATVLKDHIVTTTESVSVPGVKINTGGTVLLNNGVVFTTPQNGSFTVDGTLQTGTDGTAKHVGAGTFSLNENATLWVSSINGITKTLLLGNIQTEGTRTYHPRASYHYNGILDQETGDAVITANNFSVSGGSNKVLTQNLTINGTLNMILGDLNSGQNNVLSIANGGDIVGYKDESLIIGTLRRIGTGATSPYKVVFPLGGNKHKYLQPVTITYSGQSDVDEFTVTHIDNTHPDSDKKSTGIAVISDREYWDITPSDATRQRIQNASQNITLNIAYKSDDLKYIPDRSKDLYLLGHFNSSTVLWEPASVDATVLRDGTDASGTVTMYGVKSFSPFGIGSTDGTNPVMLTKFDARITTDKKIELTWTTEAESINKGFGIERRVDGSDQFQQIGFVNSQAHGGNSASRLHYTFIDQVPVQTETAFYRLAQADLDGKLTYSEVRLIRTGESIQCLIYPNPSSGSFIIQKPEAIQKVNIRVFHSSGKLIQAHNGISQTHVGLHIDHPGFYKIIMLNAMGEVRAQEWVVIR
ncbi:MAG: T9SS type A sorting domain-containing protein, partial [bacterium]